MSKKIDCYIIDDEPLAIEILEKYILKVPFLQLKKSFTSAVAASQISFKKSDILFLDINMPDLDGLTYMSLLDNKPIVILTTAYDEYAIKAFEMAVSDYLMKPISFERFYKGVLRINNSLQEEKAQKSPQEDLENLRDNSYIFLKVGNREQKILVEDIYFAEGMRDYLRIHTRTGKFMSLINFQKLFELLPKNKFVRIHKSYMVALNKIDHVERRRVQIANQLLPISEKYKEEFFKVLNSYK